MFVLAKVLEGLAVVLNAALNIYWWIVLIAVLISWVSPNPYNPIVRALRGATEPLFAWVRRRVPGMRQLAFSTGLDLSPIVVFLAIWFLQIVIPSVLLHYARQLQSL
ncbi:MAG TPA: YggT family protein [Thermodesulfobacteriota bacterium]|nr:YggT family protein [Thermodesulfobacteriota bacterium]